jgi:hypothetical protein
MNWSKYVRLVECLHILSHSSPIKQCIGGERLAAICRLFSESYSTWSSGFPDLCLWNYRKKEIMFSEVKGVGDGKSYPEEAFTYIMLNSQPVLSEKQKVTHFWYYFDSLVH